ncbi:MAG: site-specific DNA-methyltransferase [Planctomycetaceae bacterium]|nr:site-specific DNA-methyltransferase [Planctomycetaceae bacterium]
MHSVLKKTGSIFLHCDWHANAYIRVHILDKIFGDKNFRGDIVWQRTNAHNKTTNKLAPLTDTIWYYSKSGKCIYNPVYVNLSDEYKTSFYRYEDEKGPYQLGDLTGSDIRSGESGQEWKGYNPTVRNRHWAIPAIPIETIAGKNKAKSLSTIEKLELLLENGLIEFTGNGTPRFKRYLETSKGNLIGNIWTDIQNVQSQSKERIGYPTQKPEALMERIISMASNEGDVVLDPFVGGGTTVAVADRLNRQWIGIDQSVQAVKVTELRLDKQRDLFSAPFTVQLHKYDYDTLRYKNSFEFERWIVQQFGGVSNAKQRHDFGLDGKTPDGTPIQVKRSDNVGRNIIDNFLSSAKRADKRLYEKTSKTRSPSVTSLRFRSAKARLPKWRG